MLLIVLLNYFYYGSTINALRVFIYFNFSVNSFTNLLLIYI